VQAEEEVVAAMELVFAKKLKGAQREQKVDLKKLQLSWLTDSTKFNQR